MNRNDKKGKVIVIFGDNLSGSKSLGFYNTIIADDKFRELVNDNQEFVSLRSLIDPGNIYEAEKFLREVARVVKSDGIRISKSFIYKGYELWWGHYNNLFYNFCFPYTQYKRLLEYLLSFNNVHLYDPPKKNLFLCFLKTNGKKTLVLKSFRLKSPSLLPFGILLQMIITVISIFVLKIRKHKVLLFTGDKLASGRDYDFRLRLIYEELRKNQVPFVEFIRSLESWKTILKHAFIRKRPVIYSEAINFLGSFLSILTGGRGKANRMFGKNCCYSEGDLGNNFRRCIAVQYLLTVYDDVWSIRTMKLVLKIIGVKASLMIAGSNRNFHTLLGCKLNNIPTVGILHGVASPYSTTYDFIPDFNGDKAISVDYYGVWSNWWKEYYLENSKAYKKEQLFVSGLIRPMNGLVEDDKRNRERFNIAKPINVLLVAEQTVVPEEVMPYVEMLLSMANDKYINLTIKFRPSNDGFELWLQSNRPEILEAPHLKIVKGEMHEAIKYSDVVIGCHSTGVLEAVLQFKIPIFCFTKQWGDYYNMSGSEKTKDFIVNNPSELKGRITNIDIIPFEVLKTLQDRYFGDPKMNGSAWAVQTTINLIHKGGV